MPTLGISGAVSPCRPPSLSISDLRSLTNIGFLQSIQCGRPVAAVETLPERSKYGGVRFASTGTAGAHVPYPARYLFFCRACYYDNYTVLSDCRCCHRRELKGLGWVQGRAFHNTAGFRENIAALPAMAETRVIPADISAGSVNSASTVDDGGIIKSVEDKKSYRLITLPNGLTAILIHDPEIKTADAGEHDDNDDIEASEDEEEEDEEDEDLMTDEAGDVGKAEKVKARAVARGKGSLESAKKEAQAAGKGDGKEEEESDWETASEDEELEDLGKGTAVAAGKGEANGAVGRKRGKPAVRVGRKLGKGRAKGNAVEEGEEEGDEIEEDQEGDSDWDSEEEEDEETDEETDEDDEDGDEEEGGRRSGDMQATKKAAAAMCVGVGSFSDPDDAQGLAHFLEHMLFMGSAKYPDENDYDAFLSKHGGSSNAYTETEHTCFHFDVSDKFLKPALDRFAQFFIAPLAKEDAMEREVQAVDSEYQQVLQSDSCRLQQLQCSTAHPEHPFHKFSWGNRKSLSEEASRAGVDMRKKLLQLYLNHYKAGAMKLAVLGGEPLDVLEEWVREIFRDVRPGGGQSRLPLGFREMELWEPGLLYRVESVKEQHQLTLSWPLPCLDSAYQKKPQDYLSHLIGHEGAGSLLALLKAKGWATGLSAGVGEGGYERNSALYVFATTIHLTESGLEQAMEVIGLAYQYLAMLRQVGPQEWVFQELGAVSEMEFRFAEEEAADNYTVRLACNMQVYPVEDTIYGDYVHKEWDPSLVADIVALLSPHHMRVDLVSKEFDRAAPDVRVEPWFEVPYTVRPLAAELLQRWARPPAVDPALHLPPRNEFIPQNFSLRSAPGGRGAASTAAANRMAADGGAASGSAAERAAANGAAPGEGVASGGRGIQGANHRLPETESEVAAEGQAAEAPVADRTHVEEVLAGEAAAGDVREEGTGATSASGIQGAEANGSRGEGQLGEVAPEASSAPRVLVETDVLKLWYKLDDVFETPRANVYFAVWSPVAFSSARNAAMTELFVKLVEDSLNEVVYLANVAKLESSATASGHSIEIKIGGFNDKLPALAEKIFAHIKDFRLRADRFEVLREELARGYRNSNMKPLKQSAYLRLLLLRAHAWRVEDRLEALLACTPGDLEAFAGALLSEVFVEALVHGNLTEEEALALGSSAVSAFPSKGLPPSRRPNDRVVHLPAGVALLLSAPVKNEAEENSVVEMYFQGPQDVGRGALWDHCMVDLLEQMMYEPIYNQLRSKEQLGYRVDCGVRVTFRVIGFCIRVQSAEYAPPHLQARIEAFLEQFRGEVAAMEDAEFESHREALIAQKMQRDHSLVDESDHLWEQIWEKRYLFGARHLEAAMLRSPKIQRSDLLQWFDAFLGVGSATRRKLTVQIWGRGQNPTGVGPLRDTYACEGDKARRAEREVEGEDGMDIDREEEEKAIALRVGGRGAGSDSSNNGPASIEVGTSGGGPLNGKGLGSSAQQPIAGVEERANGGAKKMREVCRQIQNIEAFKSECPLFPPLL